MQKDHVGKVYMESLTLWKCSANFYKWSGASDTMNNVPHVSYVLT